MASSERQIENLVATYAFLVDDGDFAGLGDLLDSAEFTLGDSTVRGRAAIERLAAATLQVFSDGTPRTRHVTTNLVIEVDERVGTATSRSYFTVLQQTEDLPLQPVACGRYRDAFDRTDGAWRFIGRTVSLDLAGDTSHHVLASAHVAADATSTTNFTDERPL